MKIIKKFLYLIMLYLPLAGCSPQAARDAAGSLSLSFEGRKIDLSPYLKEFPYSQFSVSKDGSKLFFFKTDTENRLQWIETSKDAALDKASNVIDLDFSKRNCWSPRYNEKDSFFYWMGDEKNDEIINIYRTKPGSNVMDQLTDVPYIYAWSFNPSRTKIAYVARLGQNEDRLDELRIIDLLTLEDKLVCSDTPNYRFTWGDISWHPTEKGLALLALKGIDRTYANVVYVDLETKQITPLTDSNKRASLSGCRVMEEWLSDNECLFFSDQDGYANLYSFNLRDKTVKQTTQYTVDIDDAAFVTIDNSRYLIALQSNPVETKLILIDPSTNEVAYTQSSNLGLRIGTANGNRLTLIAGSTTELFQLVEAKVSIDAIDTEVVFDIPSALKQKLVHSTVERLEIPTFDTDPSTDTQRRLHAYLYKPDIPLPKGKALVMIESFYGGSNHYDSEYQILCNAGIYVLSPSPRGSDGFGRDFAAMNDGDLGGNEIIDIICAAQYISGLLDIPAERIGVFGMSHGGYATMRLMTFPGEANGNTASFPFGFGIETAGFCDILWQHSHTNIPDWTALEAGDPATDSVRLIARSPITHADKISGPLLLIHGDHDNRVDIEGSRFMAQKLEELGKAYRYVEFPGLGHGIKGIDNSYKYYSECLDFLQDYVLR
ncbi:MAG: prolyl oligopeptidase family serine peptidase [Tannerellaceae bacterium]|jgi:dipeptidyl aminopeptidase/acylaminoacyl peptidase|nr:prolyl oligopeptidase family serine peptidase [Tannerellaceae bacterium]